MSVIDKVYLNGGLLFKKTIYCYSRQKVGYKVLNERCLECSICAMFLSSSLTVTLLQRFPVIHVCGTEHKIENLTFVIDYQMRLESEEPSH